MSRWVDWRTGEIFPPKVTTMLSWMPIRRWTRTQTTTSFDWRASPCLLYCVQSELPLLLCWLDCSLFNSFFFFCSCLNTIMLSEPVLVWVQITFKRRDLMFSHQSNHNQSVAAFTQAKHFIDGCLEISGIWYAGNKIKSILTGSTDEVLQHVFIFQTFLGFILQFPVFQRRKKNKKTQPAVHMSRATVTLSSLHGLNVPYFSFVLLVCSPLFLIWFCFVFAHTACYAAMPLMNTRGVQETFYCASVRLRGR